MKNTILEGLSMEILWKYNTVKSVYNEPGYAEQKIDPVSSFSGKPERL